MGLREDGERWARAVRAEEVAAAEVQARNSISTPPPWIGELLNAVRGKVQPVAVYDDDFETRRDRTLIRQKERVTHDYRFIEHRWVVAGTPGGESEWGQLYLDSFAFSEQGFLYNAGTVLTPQVSGGRFSVMVVNNGLLDGPARLGSRRPLQDDVYSHSWHRRLASFAVHRLATGECRFLQPGEIFVGHYGRDSG